jgi:uncharacterized MAPEG superfamily protein
MKAPEVVDHTGFAGRSTPAGKASFEWAILFATIAILFPVSGLVGICFADRSRRKGYPRWLAALLVSAWCAILGSLVRSLLHIGIFP